jgi:outer membrane protein assembly factor BamB
LKKRMKDMERKKLSKENGKSKKPSRAVCVLLVSMLLLSSSNLLFDSSLKAVEAQTTHVISNVSTITATRLQTIYIYGSGFGNTPPQTDSLGDGSVDTVWSTTTPSLVIWDTSGGVPTWSAGFENSSIFDAIGIILVSWADNEIVLGGFGSALGTSGESAYNIAVGDQLIVNVQTPSGSATYNTTVASPSPSPTPTSTSSPSPSPTPTSTSSPSPAPPSPYQPPTGIDWWCMFGHDPTHAGYSTSKAPETGTQIWNYTTDDAVDSSPAVAGGIVYVGSDDDNVYALNAETGTQVWKYTTGGFVDSSPAVAGGIVYVGSGDGHVYALNAETGTQIWNCNTWGSIGSSPAVAGGYLYVESNNGILYCLNAETGTEIWNYTTEGVDSPAVAGTIVYIGSGDDHVYALNAETGTQIWNYTTGNAVYSSSAVAGGIVYVGSDDDNVYALNAETGTQVWKYTTGDIVEASPAVADGKVYIASLDGNFYCLNALSGSKIWTCELYDVSSAAIADGKVYVNSDETVYAFGSLQPTVTLTPTVSPVTSPSSSPAPLTLSTAVNLVLRTSIIFITAMVVLGELRRSRRLKR